MTTAAEMITELRKTMSRREIAEHTNLTQAKIANIEKGRDTTVTEELAIRAVYDQFCTDLVNSISSGTEPPTVPKPEPVAEPSLQQMYIMHQNKLVDPITKQPIGVADPVELEPAEPVVLISPSNLTAKDGIRRVSSSELASFKRCRRQWWLAYYRGLIPLNESPLGPRAIGDRIHRALQRYYVPDSQPRTELVAALEEVIQEDWIATKAAFAGKGEEVPPQLVIDLNKQADLERAMITGYVEWLAETGSDSEFKVIGSERYIEANLTTIGEQQINLIGRLDVQVRRVYDGMRFFLDHKTLGEFTTSTRLLPMNEQMKMYVLLYVLNSEPDQRIAGAIYNMMRRVKRTDKAKPPFYQRVEVQHNPTEIQTFKERTIGTITHMESARRLLDMDGDHHRIVYPTPTKDCAWQCAFANICVMHDDGSRVEAAIENHFVVGDPYAYYAMPAENFQQ